MAKKQIALHPIQLLNANISEIKVKVLRDEVPDQQPNLGVEISTACQPISDEEAFSFLKINIGFSEGEPLFDMQLVFRGRVKAINPCTAEELKGFAENHAIPLLWPFAREYIYSLTPRIGFPAVMLPTINVFGTIETNTEKQELSE